MQSPPPFVLPPESRADRLRGLLAGAGRQRAVVALLVLLALAGAAALRLRAEPAPLHATTAAGPPVRSLPSAAPQAATAKQVAVDVVGRVRHPGLVHLPAGSRVADAIRAAGGVTARARLDAVNLARKVVDGEQIRIPAPGEALAPPASGGPDPGAPTSGRSTSTPPPPNSSTPCPALARSPPPASSTTATSTPSPPSPSSRTCPASASAASSSSRTW
jgi:DNA uptake protein ComE-like DNA-binding protein